MPSSCVVFKCSNHNMMKDKKLHFYKFPSRSRSPERRDKWLAACHQQNANGSKWSPVKTRVICSEHFITGLPNKTDPQHPDYVPCILPFKHGSYEKAKRQLERYERTVNRSLACNETPEPPEPVSEEIGLEIQGPDSGNVERTEYRCQSTRKRVEELEAVMDDVDISILGNANGCIATEMQFLREERDKAQAEVQRLQAQLSAAKLSASTLNSAPESSQFFTGLSASVFKKTFAFLQQFHPKDSKDSMPLIDQFFLMLVKLRMDLPFELIARISGFGETTVRDYFWKWIDLVDAKLHFLVKFQDREVVKKTLPQHFRELYPRLTSIFDCFELFIETPKTPKARAQTYSSYKHHNTVKVFICCSPLGAVTYISKAWGGRVSDVELVRRSGFIQNTFHMPGDQLLADRGFTLKEDFATACSAELIIPSFTKGKNQLSAAEVEKSRQLASVRIHIERVIGLMRNRYAILRSTLQIPMIKSAFEEQQGAECVKIDRLLKTCAIMVNLGEGIVVKKQDTP